MAGTQITGGDQVSDAFAPIYQMIGSRGSSVSGGGTGTSGLQTQNIQGNDLTQMQRSLTNLLGTTGAQLGQLGQGVLGAGLTGAETGFGSMAQGLETLNQPLSYWQALLSGNPQTTSAAVAPTAANLATLYSGATNQATQGMPAGGYRASTLAGLPQAQASQLGNALLQLQPTAATNIAGLGQAQAQIGQQQGALGTQVGQLGTTLTSEGLQALQSTAEDVLRKMGINIEGGTANLFGKVASGIGALV